MVHRQKRRGGESGLYDRIRDELSAGVEMAADPTNANLPALSLLTTTINSPWYARTCGVCQDKFRETDQVRVCPRCGEAYHDDHQYDLHCWQTHFAGGKVCTEGGEDRFSGESRQIPRCDYSWNGQLPKESSRDSSGQTTRVETAPSEALVAQFVGGVETIWRPYGGRKSFKVRRGSPLVGRKCPWCRFRVRVGDWVVECPCGSQCGTVFHQDVFRHLTCWNEWQGAEQGRKYCPTTSAPFKDEEPGAPELAGETAEGGGE